MKALTIVSSVVFLHVLAFVVLVNGCSTRASRAKATQEQYAPASGIPSSGESVAPSAGEPIPPTPVPEEPLPEEPSEPEVKPPPAPTSEQDATTTVYVVKQNDSLWLIAKKHGTTIDAICKANGIKKNSILRTGTSLKIPAKQAKTSETASEKAVNGTTYTVKKGDVLGIIARRNGVTVKAIKEANNLSSDNIRIGQKLIIPAKNTPTPKPEPAPAPQEPAPAPVVEPELPEEPESDFSAEPLE